MPRRLVSLLAIGSLSLAAPGRAVARDGGAPEVSRPLPAAPLTPELVSPLDEVTPAAPRVVFWMRLPPRQPPEPPDAPPPQPERQAEDLASPAEENWLDAGHAFLAEKLFAPVLLFDRFFSDETALDAERSRSFLRWRSELRLDGGDTPTYATTLRADLRLPGLNRVLDRLRLVVEGQTRDAMTSLFGEDDPERERIGTGGAELRLRLWEGLIAHGDLGAGLLLELPPGAFGRARLRWAIPVGDLFLTRLATTGFWRTDTRFGASVDVHLERGIKRAALARLSGQAQLTQVSRGVEWSSEAALLRAFTRRVAGTLGVGMNGVTEGARTVERYRVATRLRGDLYRRWLFVETEPEVYWPWTPERGRHAEYAVTFRLEVQFRGWDAERRGLRRRTQGSPPEPLAPAPPPLGIGGLAEAGRGAGEGAPAVAPADEPARLARQARPPASPAGP